MHPFDQICLTISIEIVSDHSIMHHLQQRTSDRVERKNNVLRTYYTLTYNQYYYYILRTSYNMMDSLHCILSTTAASCAQRGLFCATWCISRNVVCFARSLFMFYFLLFSLHFSHHHLRPRRDAEHVVVRIPSTKQNEQSSLCVYR